MKNLSVRAMLLAQLVGLLVVLTVWFSYHSTLVSQAAVNQPFQPNLLVRSNGQPDYIAINKAIDKLPSDIPKDIVKAIAWLESNWQQFDLYGNPNFSVNINDGKKTHLSCDWGLMQINDQTFCLSQSQWSFDQVMYDPIQNLKAGIAILQLKEDYVQLLKKKENWPIIERRFRLKGRDDMAIVLKAYNGFQPSWDYPDQVMRYVSSRPWEDAMLEQLREETSTFYPAQFVGIVNWQELSDDTLLGKQVLNGYKLSTNKNPKLLVWITTCRTEEPLDSKRPRENDQNSIID